MQEVDPSVLSQSRTRTLPRLGKAAILPVLCHLGLLITYDLAQHLFWTLSMVGIGFAGLVLAERQLARLSPKRVFWSVMVIGFVLRALLLPLPPSLSGDVNRYLWDGRVVAAGLDPYSLAPDAPELVPLRDPLWSELDHREVPTVYPPLAQAAFVFAAWLPMPLLGMKSLLMLLDLGGCVLLWGLARRWRVPAERTIWYVWNPLVTVEIAGMGHIDGLGVALVILTTVLLAVRPQRFAGALLSATGAILAKLVPLLAIPVWARQSRRPWLFISLVVILSVVGLLPAVLGSGGVPPGLVRYGVSWEFNGPLFEPLWRLLDILHIDAAAEAGLNKLKEIGGDHVFWNHFYPLNYPQLWAKGILALGLLWALSRAWKSSDTPSSLRQVFGSVIIFSATVYPWYALWVLPWAALTRSRAWLTLSGLLFLSYIPQVLGIAIFPWIYCVIWLPFAVVMLRYR